MILVLVDNDPAKFVGASLMLLGLGTVGVEPFKGDEAAGDTRE